MNEAPLCACGCGADLKSRPDGTYAQFARGHYLNRMMTPEERTHRQPYLLNGYRMVPCDGHPRANENGFVLEHVLIAEKVLGHYLSPENPVHHWNQNRADNRNENLVVCPSDAYHFLLHQRMRAMDACGNPSWRKCHICKKYDDPVNLRFHGKEKNHVVHLKCASERQVRIIDSRRTTPKRAMIVTPELALAIRNDPRGPAAVARDYDLSAAYISNIRANRKRKLQ